MAAKKGNGPQPGGDQQVVTVKDYKLAWLSAILGAVVVKIENMLGVFEPIFAIALLATFLVILGSYYVIGKANRLFWIFAFIGLVPTVWAVSEFVPSKRVVVELPVFAVHQQQTITKKNPCLSTHLFFNENAEGIQSFEGSEPEMRLKMPGELINRYRNIDARVYDDHQGDISQPPEDPSVEVTMDAPRGDDDKRLYVWHSLMNVAGNKIYTVRLDFCEIPGSGPGSLDVDLARKELKENLKVEIGFDRKWSLFNLLKSQRTQSE